MNKQEELANKIIDDISEMIEKYYPEIKPKCITDDDTIENPSLINGTVYYDLESKIADDIKRLLDKQQEYKAIELVAELIKALEEQAPEYYYKSDLIAKCNDFLKVADGEGNE